MVSCVAQLNQQTEHSSIRYEVYMERKGVSNDMLVAEGDLYQAFRSVGASGVRALPLAAGRNVGGHSTWHYFLSLSSF